MADLSQSVEQKTRSQVGIRAAIGTLFVLLGIGFLAASGMSVFNQTTSNQSTVCRDSSALLAETTANDSSELELRTALETQTRNLENLSTGDFPPDLQTVLESRKRNLLSLLAENPTAAKEYLLSSHTRDRLSSLAVNCIEQSVNLTGAIRYQIGEYFGSETDRSSQIEYQFVSPETVHELTFTSAPERLPAPGMGLKVVGVSLENYLFVDGAATAEAPNDLGGLTELNSAAGPILSNISVSVSSSFTATVSWMTDIPADGVVNWGLTSAYGSRKSNYNYALAHAIAFPVTQNTTYHYAIRGCTSTGLCTTSPDATFVTGVSNSPPSLTNIQVTVTNGVASVNWTTNMATDGVVNWGTSATACCQVTAESPGFRTAHQVNFSVASNTTYFYTVKSCSQAAICTTSSIRSFITSSTLNPGPVIQNVVVSVYNGQARISWTTNIPADGVVNWGTTSAYGSLKNDTAFTLSHAISFPIASFTTYHYAIRGCTNLGNCTTTPNATFNTDDPSGVPPQLPPLPAPIPSKSTLILMVNLANTNTEVPTKSEVEKTMFTDVKNYYLENSYGRHQVSGQVRGWLKIHSSTSSCGGLFYIPNVAAEAVAAAEQQDPNFRLTDFAHLMIVAPFSGSGCYDGASIIGSLFIPSREGQVSIGLSYMKSSHTNFYVLGHEYGHQLGIYHASFHNCIASTGACSIWEYGDWSDIMGANGLIGIDGGHYTAPHKASLGWLNQNSLLTVQASGRYEIEPIETATNGVKAIRLRQTGADNMYLEYRQPIGFDAPLAEQGLDFFDGLLIHTDPKPSVQGGLYDSILHDATPPSNGDWRQVSLRVGSTFVDPISNNRITVVSKSPEKIIVDIVVVADFTAPTVTITSPVVNQPVSRTITVKASAFDNIGVTKVEFYQNNTLFATDTSAPFEVSLNTAQFPNGLRTIYARAFDARNYHSKSSLVTVDIRNKVPEIIQNNL